MYLGMELTFANEWTIASITEKGLTREALSALNRFMAALPKPLEAMFERLDEPIAIEFVVDHKRDADSVILIGHPLGQPLKLTSGTIFDCDPYNDRSVAHETWLETKRGAPTTRAVTRRRTARRPPNSMGGGAWRS